MPEIEDETEERTFKKIIVSVEWLGTLSREVWGQVSVCVTTLVLWLNGLNYFTGVYTVKCSLAQWSWQVVKSPVGLFLARTLVCLSVPDRNIFIALARMDICMCSGCTFSSFPGGGIFQDNFWKAGLCVVLLFDTVYVIFEHKLTMRLWVEHWNPNQLHLLSFAHPVQSFIPLVSVQTHGGSALKTALHKNTRTRIFPSSKGWWWHSTCSYRIERALTVVPKLNTHGHEDDTGMYFRLL